MKHVYKCLLGFAIAGLALVQVEPSNARTLIQQNTIDSLQYMRSVYGTTYAPTEWKKQFANWSLDSEFDSAIQKVDTAGETLTVVAARRILMDFIYSMRDYHVSISFVSTQASTLPFTIRGAEGKFIIVNIDRTKLGEDIFPFAVGDELVSLDGRAAADVVSELAAGTALNTLETDQALAEFAVTRRRFSRGVPAPTGPVVVGVMAKGATTVSYRQLIWEHKAEKVKTLASGKETLDIPVRKPIKAPLIKKFMMTANQDLFLAGDNENRHLLGVRNSFLPELGEKIWESEATEKFQAYIYRGDNNKMIGVVRIPGYSFDDDSDKTYVEAVASFSKIINRMEKLTDALIIDQLNNPGGSVFYLYALASTLSNQPMKTPRHTMSITPVDVLNCVTTLDQLAALKTDEEIQKAVGDEFHGYPVNVQTLEFYKNYCGTIIADWNEGRTMSRPYWIAGVDQLNPYPKGTYTKPIMVLVNELDFSGGDFFPTILQDNNRAKIFGTRTSGAGGYVNEYEFPNILGVSAFRVTQSLAHRVSNNPIENLGVTPDISYIMKASDLQNNFADYMTAVKAAVNGIMTK
jgi:hypothetical protein